ncbi:MAG: DUF4396 domain-containing protein [Gemmatimonadaceae bacterium]|nr:DUF4396 domain-containing protein [Gemmatimonadaceae bacterium]
MIERSLIAWFALTAVSVLYVAWDTYRNNPEMVVMKYGFILVTLFMGPVGACVYVLSCKPPVPRDHAAFVNPLWKQAVGSTVHCLAGDATGIIVAAAITMAMGLVMWHDLLAEYALGFGFGLFVFQALFTRQMLGGSYFKALRKSLYPEWVSMNAVMAGMIPTMVVIMSRDMTSMHPASLRFWGVMSIASTVGFFVAYPVNLWLAGVGLKHGMGTVLALGEGGHSPEMEGAPAMAMAHDSMPAGATRQQRWAMAVLSLVALWAGVLLAAWGGDLTMSPSSGMAGMPSAIHPMPPPNSQP